MIEPENRAAAAWRTPLTEPVLALRGHDVDEVEDHNAPWLQDPVKFLQKETQVVELDVMEDALGKDQVDGFRGYPFQRWRVDEQGLELTLSIKILRHPLAHESRVVDEDHLTAPSDHVARHPSRSRTQFEHDGIRTDVR